MKTGYFSNNNFNEKQGVALLEAHVICHKYCTLCEAYVDNPHNKPLRKVLHCDYQD